MIFNEKLGVFLSSPIKILFYKNTIKPFTEHTKE